MHGNSGAVSVEACRDTGRSPQMTVPGGDQDFAAG